MTFDDDYLRLAHAGVRHAGIFYCHATKYAVGGLVRAVAAAAAEAESPGDRVRFI